MLAEAVEGPDALDAPSPRGRPGWLTVHQDGRIQLWDIKDARNFVQATLNASRRIYPPDEREELVGEGMAILYKLACDYDPNIGRFSGFAAKYLRLKLEDAYHRLHPEHILRTQQDGSRRYEYGERAVSWQAITSEDGEDREQALASREEGDAPVSTIESLLREQYEERFNTGMRVAGLLAEGITSDREIAEALGLTTAQVREARADLEPVAQRLRTLSQR